MKFLLSILMVCVLGVACADDPLAVKLPEGGPFVNEKDFPFGGNPKYYYWIDLVSKTDGEVVFKGDAPCDLPDPKFMAKGGITNRVILLIGKKYTATAKSKISVVGKSAPDVRVQVKGEKTVRVFWPFVFGAVATPPKKK